VTNPTDPYLVLPSFGPSATLPDSTHHCCHVHIVRSFPSQSCSPYPHPTNPTHYFSSLRLPLVILAFTTPAHSVTLPNFTLQPFSVFFLTLPSPPTLLPLYPRCPLPIIFLLLSHIFVPPLPSRHRPSFCSPHAHIFRLLHPIP